MREMENRGTDSLSDEMCEILSICLSIFYMRDSEKKKKVSALFCFVLFLLCTYAMFLSILHVCIVTRKVR